MLPQEIIRHKRNKQALSNEEINFFINEVTKGNIVDAQTAALTMAVFLNGMNKEDLKALFTSRSQENYSNCFALLVETSAPWWELLDKLDKEKAKQAAHRWCAACL